MQECLWLCQNGVPFDVSFRLDEYTRAAWSIIFSQFHGQAWDWDMMAFKKPPRE